MQSKQKEKVFKYLYYHGKKGLVFVILFLGIFIFFSVNFVSAFSGTGNGSLANPYDITNCTPLQEMRDDLSAHYQLVGNINCSETSEWNSGAGFEPIGIDISGQRFNGKFNGNGFNINNLLIDKESDYVGLFGAVGASGYINNVTLVYPSINGLERVGALFGK